MDATASGGMCSVEGCGRRVVARGWCAAHYQARRRRRPASEAGPCKAPGCNRGAYCRGLCHTHYHRRYTGSPLGTLPIRGAGGTYLDRAAVFGLRAAGFSERAIAARLGVSRSEVNGILRGVRQPQGAAA